MGVTDVDHVVQPGGSTLPNVQRRLTLQHFTATDIVVTGSAPHNSDARIASTADWPPNLFFDIAYGCAALNQWADAAFLDVIRGRSGGHGTRGRGGRGNRGGRRGNRDRGGDGDRREGGKEDGQAKMTNRAERAARRAKARDEATNAAKFQVANCADVVFALWTHSARMGRHQAEAANADRTQDKVQTWLDSTA